MHESLFGVPEEHKTDQEPSMSNVLKRLFHRHAEREEAERKHCDQGEASSLLEPKLVQPANDATPAEPTPAEPTPAEPTPAGPTPAGPTGDAIPVAGPTGDVIPVKPTSDEETIELQIAALISAWDKTSLCARRVFLTRIDQRIMTTHLIRSASRNPARDGAAAVDRDCATLLPVTDAPAASP
jgi:hypothetical protein